jgi:hypothetical protein
VRWIAEYASTRVDDIGPVAEAVSTDIGRLECDPAGIGAQAAKKQAGLQAKLRTGL